MFGRKYMQMKYPVKCRERITFVSLVRQRPLAQNCCWYVVQYMVGFRTMLMRPRVVPCATVSFSWLWISGNHPESAGDIN